MTERETKISIIIPVHNAERHLGACLDSCLVQSLPAIEIICVNDASDDDSARILADYSARDERIRTMTFQKNRGTLEARRAAVNVARGDYALFVDADDVLKPTACDRLWRSSGGRDFLLFSLEAFAEDDAAARERAALFNARKISTVERELEAEECLTELFVREAAPLGLAGKLLRTRLIHSGYSKVPSGYCVCGEDGLVVLASLMDGAKGYCIPDRLYGYRLGSGISTSEKWSYKRRLQWLRSGRFCAQVLSSYKRFFPSNLLWSGIMRCLVKRAELIAWCDADFSTRMRLSLDKYALWLFSIMRRLMEWTRRAQTSIG